MRAIISGAGSFLGRRLLNNMVLSERVDSIIALDMNISELTQQLTNPDIQIQSNEEFLSGSHRLTNYVLINLAYARSSEFPDIKSSCDWTFKLLEKLKNCGLNQIINISSHSVYDCHRSAPAKESDLTIPNSLYDMGKYYIENWIEGFARKHKCSFINLRASSLVGPGLHQRITTRLLRQAMLENEISINLNGQIFSYTHVSDMANAIIAAAMMRSENSWNRVFNVGSEESYTIEDIAETIERIFVGNGLHLRINRIAALPNKLNGSLDSTLFRSVADWQPKYTLEDILTEEFYEQWGKCP